MCDFRIAEQLLILLSNMSSIQVSRRLYEACALLSRRSWWAVPVRDSCGEGLYDEQSDHTFLRHHIAVVLYWCDAPRLNWCGGVPSFPGSRLKKSICPG